jgi:hypothetical protein
MNNRTQMFLDTLLYSFWSMIDISDNIDRVRAVLRRFHANQSKWFMLVVIGLIALGSGILSIYFDFAPTFITVSAWTGDFISALQTVSGGVGLPWNLDSPEQYVRTAGYVGLILTLFPTLIEFFGIPFAQVGIAVFRLAFYGMLVFDLATDTPVIREFIAHYSFASFGALGGWIVHKITFLIFLFLATFGFEAILAVSLYAFFYLLWLEFTSLKGGGKSSSKRKSRHPDPNPNPNPNSNPNHYRANRNVPPNYQPTSNYQPPKPPERKLPW